MNASPHTHRVQIQHKIIGFYDGTCEGYPTYVTYGDTRVKLCTGFTDPTKWSPAKMERKFSAALAKAIRLHDEGSKQAGLKAERERQERERDRERSRTLFGLVNKANQELTTEIALSADLRTGYQVTGLAVPRIGRETWGGELQAIQSLLSTNTK